MTSFGTASTSSSPAPTFESIMRAMDEIFPRLKEGTEKLGAATVAASASMYAFGKAYERAVNPVVGHLLGVKVVKSWAAVSRVSVRKHKHRRGQSLAYHRRVQKKWDKRFGFDMKPCIYKLADGTLIVHPTTYEAMRRAT